VFTKISHVLGHHNVYFGITIGGATASPSGSPREGRQQRPQKRSSLHGVISHAAADVLSYCTVPETSFGQIRTRMRRMGEVKQKVVEVVVVGAMMMMMMMMTTTTTMMMMMMKTTTTMMMMIIIIIIIIIIKASSFTAV
jgi:hypothetical protein